MDVYEASKYLKLSPNTIYQWKYEEKIPSIKLGGKLLFDRNELDDFIDNLSKKQLVNEFIDKRVLDNQNSKSHNLIYSTLLSKGDFMSTDKNIFGLLTIKQLADALNAKEQTVYSWRRDEKIPEYCFVKIGGTIYALERRVREFLYNNGGLVNDNI